MRTWWSLHSIECLVCSITGRPPAIPNENCTIQLPQSLSSKDRSSSKRHQPMINPDRSHQESSPSNTFEDTEDYHVSSISIALLTHNVLSSLYAPRTASRSWQVRNLGLRLTQKTVFVDSEHLILTLSQEIEGKIEKLLKDLEDWSNGALSATVCSSPSQKSEFEREQSLLLMRYWSTRILITRPCLCRTERRIRNESDVSAAFNSEMASICVKSARELAALFPHTPDLVFVYRRGPWWDIVHISKTSENRGNGDTANNHQQSCSARPFCYSNLTTKTGTPKTAMRRSPAMFRS